MNQHYTNSFYFVGTHFTQNTDMGLFIYYVILFWPLSDPYPIKLAASYLLKTRLTIKIDNKIYPLPPSCYTDMIFSLNPCVYKVLYQIILTAARSSKYFYSTKVC